MNTLDKEYEEMGRMNENQYLPIFKEKYGNLIKSDFKFDTIDFYGKDFMIELKSRTCSSSSFTETMFGYNKLLKAKETLKKNNDYKVFFAFAFTDGLFVWEYNQNTFEINGGENQKRIGGTKNRGYDDYKEHYYIKMKNLIKISDASVWIHPSVLQNTKKVFKSAINDEICFLLGLRPQATLPKGLPRSLSRC